ncbi:hypothetical protein C8Q72DRAFT_626245 [Fomitopsis betulina]|nr:hypothetical protein C8Q72DRAFT_626245 [Fomitopsis betulina]
MWRLPRSRGVLIKGPDGRRLLASACWDACSCTYPPTFMPTCPVRRPSFAPPISSSARASAPVHPHIRVGPTRHVLVVSPRQHHCACPLVPKRARPFVPAPARLFTFMSACCCARMCLRICAHLRMPAFSHLPDRPQLHLPDRLRLRPPTTALVLAFPSACVPLSGTPPHCIRACPARLRIFTRASAMCGCLRLLLCIREAQWHPSCLPSLSLPLPPPACSPHSSVRLPLSRETLATATAKQIELQTARKVSKVSKIRFAPFHFVNGHQLT